MSFKVSRDTRGSGVILLGLVKFEGIRKGRVETH